MSSVTKNISKILVCALVLALVFPLVNLVGGSLATTNGENVKVQDHQFIIEEMDPSGKVDNVRVMDWLALKGDGTVDVQRSTGLSKPPKIQNMKGFAAPEVKGDTIYWKGLKASGPVNVSNVVSQNILNKDDITASALTEKVPLLVRYTYFLDGKRVKLQDIAGKSGHFRLECYMKNLSKKKEMVTYTDSTTGELKTELTEVYLPLVVSPMDWYFDNDVYSNVKTDPTGIISYIPTDFQISWSIPLFPPATEPDNTIWMEADVKDFSMKPLSLTCAFIFPKTNQNDPIPQFQAGLATLYGGVELLGAGLAQAVAGVGSTGTSMTLLWAIGQITGGLKQLADPGAGLPFAESMINTQFIPGAQQLYAGLGSATTPDTLLYGADQIFGGLLQFQAGIGTAETPNTLLYGINAMVGGLNQMSAGVGSATTPDSLLQGIGLPTDSALAGQLTLFGGLNDIKAGVGSVANPVSLIGGIGNTTDSALAGQLTLFGGLNDIKAGIGDTLTPDTLLNGVYQIYEKLPAMVEGFSPVPAYINEPTTGILIPDNVAAALELMADPNGGGPGSACPGMYVLMMLLGQPADHQGVVTFLVNGLGPATPGLEPQICGAPYEPVAPGSAYTGALQLQAGVGNPTDSFRGGQKSLFGGLNDIKAGIGNATTPDTLLNGVGLPTDSFQAGQATLLGGLNDIYAGVGNATTPNTLLAGVGLPTDSALAGQLTLIGGLNDIKAGIGSATTNNTLLYGANAITGGLTQMQGGLGSPTTNPSLLYGANAVFGGLTQIKGSVSTGSMANPGLLEGLEQLGSGLNEAVAGLGSPSNSNSLIGGSTAMQSGLEELAAGLMQASTGVNDQMAPGIAENLKTLDITVGQLEAIRQRGQKFDTFLGRVDNKGSTSDMRFLLQTKPVQNPNQGKGWLIALVISLVGGAALVVMGLFAFKKFA